MTIILNSEVLSELINNNNINILKKNQKDSNNSNYYFNPSMGLNLWRSKVIFTNPKFIVLQFKIVDNINLLTLLRNIDTRLQRLLKSKYSELFNVDIYSIMSERDDIFTIRCHLPNYKGKYFIKNETDNGDSVFKLPLLNATIDHCMIEIRNVWQTDKKYGFNVELKSVKYL